MLNTAATTVDAEGNTIYYAGDPGVRNPTIFLGYPSATYPGTPPTGTTTTVGTTTTTRTTPWATTYQPSYPPAIPVRRLFQVADSYRGSGTFGVGVTAIGATTTGGPVTSLTAAAAPGTVAFVNGPSNAQLLG